MIDDNVLYVILMRAVYDVPNLLKKSWPPTECSTYFSPSPKMPSNAIFLDFKLSWELQTATDAPSMSSQVLSPTSPQS